MLRFFSKSFLKPKNSIVVPTDVEKFLVNYTLGVPPSSWTVLQKMVWRAVKFFRVGISSAQRSLTMFQSEMTKRWISTSCHLIKCTTCISVVLKILCTHKKVLYVWHMKCVAAMNNFSYPKWKFSFAKPYIKCETWISTACHIIKCTTCISEVLKKSRTFVKRSICLTYKVRKVDV